MKSVTTRAIILMTRDYGESDRLVAFFSEAEGRLTGIAKGARRSRKRFVNSLEVFSRVEISYRTKKSLAWIEACKLLEPYLGLRADLERFTLASLACEIVLDLTPEGERQEECFSLLDAALRHLAKDRDPLNVAMLFVLRLMDIGGYLPALNACSVCGAALPSSSRWWWDMGKGSLVCRHHDRRGNNGVPLDLGSLTLIQSSRKRGLDWMWRCRFTQEKRGSLFYGLMDWVREHTRKDLRSLGVLRQIQSLR